MKASVKIHRYGKTVIATIKAGIALNIVLDGNQLDGLKGLLDKPASFSIEVEDADDSRMKWSVTKKNENFVFRPFSHSAKLATSSPITVAVSLLSNYEDTASGNVEHRLRVIRDAAGHKIADKLFDTYVLHGSADVSRRPEFAIALDRLLLEFGGKPVELEEENALETIEDDYDQDDDLHEDDPEVEVAFIRDSIRSTLGLK